MAEYITKDQLEELIEAEHIDREEYHKLLKEYTGIVAERYIGYSYCDDAGDYIGDSHSHDVRDLLENAYIRVVDNG